MKNKKESKKISPEVRTLLSLRAKGISLREIEYQIFGRRAGNGSWALYHLNLNKVAVK